MHVVFEYLKSVEKGRSMPILAEKVDTSTEFLNNKFRNTKSKPNSFCINTFLLMFYRAKHLKHE